LGQELASLEEELKGKTALIDEFELGTTSMECPLQTEAVFVTTHKKLESLEVEAEVEFDSVRF
jgi:hypothetical protein